LTISAEFFRGKPLVRRSENLRLTPAERVERVGAALRFVEAVRTRARRARDIDFARLLEALTSHEVAYIIAAASLPPPTARRSPRTRRWRPSSVS
jgi:hypothetical protein